MKAIINTRRRGTAMVETVMAIPLLAMILGLTWWVGWAMTNQQRVKASDRYTAWRANYGGGVTTDSLNTDFFQLKANPNTMDISYGVGANTTVTDYVNAAAQVSQGAAGLADSGPRQRYPQGRRVSVSAEFPTSIGLWNRYQGSITSSHSRDGVEWRYHQASLIVPVIDQYLPTIEAAMMGVHAPADGMAMMVRGLYGNGW